MRLLLILALAGAVTILGHDLITTNMTWNREVSRVILVRCAWCHRNGGSAFSLMSYEEARPWATAIKHTVLRRSMPPWGAVKGFGAFRNDQSLTQQQIDIIAQWVDGGAPEGDPRDLPVGASVPQQQPPKKVAGGIVVSGEYSLPRAVTLDGVLPSVVKDNADFRVTAVLPSGEILPLVWLRGYRTRFGHAFLFRAPIELPAGTAIRGVPDDSKIILLSRA